MSSRDLHNDSAMCPGALNIKNSACCQGSTDVWCFLLHPHFQDNSLRQILLFIPTLWMRALRLRQIESHTRASQWWSHDLKPDLPGYLITALPGISQGLSCYVWHVEGVQGRLLDCLEDKYKGKRGQNTRRPVVMSYNTCRHSLTRKMQENRIVRKR